MNDTIKIAHLCSRIPDLEDLRVRGLHEKPNRTGKDKYWVYQENGAFPYLSLFTAPDGKVYLSVRVSMPKFLFGSNLDLPNQEGIRQGLSKLSEYVTEKSGLEFDAKTAIVWEVHFTKDFFVGEYRMKQVISKLSAMNIPRFDKAQHSESTLYFHSKGTGKISNKPRTICIYDKHKERLSISASANDIEQSKGILRLEFRYKKTNVVKTLVKKLHLPNREAQTILTESVSNIVLDSVERQILSLLEESSSENPIIKLRGNFSKRRTDTLISHLAHLHYFGSKYYKIESLRMLESAFYKNQKDCRDAGVYTLFDLTENIIQVDDIP